MSSSLPKGHRPSFLQLILPFWRSEQRWKAWMMLALVVGIGFGQVYLMVFSNKLDGQVMDAMVARNWGTLWPILSVAMAVGVAGIVVVTTRTALFGLLELQWRTWMTQHYLDAWTRGGAYYDIEREGRLDNVDQRIAEDVARFVQMTLNNVTGVIFVLSNMITFTVLLWTLSGTLTFTIAGREISIPGYQVWLVYAYGISVVLITHFLGRQLMALFNRRQTVEADFRFLGMQLRENAEQVAFYRGGAREYQRMENSFERVRDNTTDIIWRTFKMTIGRDVYVQACSILPTLASLPRYLSGAISLGDLTRTVGAFGSVSSSLSWWYQAYIGFAEWIAIGNRLRDLSAALGTHEAIQNKIHMMSRDQPEIAVSELHLRAPNGASLAHIAPLCIGAGERWLLRGASGSGKSTLLRAIAGLWPHGEGQVSVPAAASLMFLPQRSYIPAGTLKAGLCYPAAPETFAEDACCEVLETCGLGHYAVSLDEEDRWQKRLSGGEQQRLAVARALLHKPDFLFLDEATSALDPPAEQALYGALRERLPDTTLVSVAHRESLADFHDHALDISGAKQPLPA